MAKKKQAASEAAEAEVGVEEVVDPAAEVELTDEEHQAAVDAALQSKKSDVRTVSAREKAEAEETEARELRKADPGRFIGVDKGAHGSYSYRELVNYRDGDGFARTINLSGKTYEHVETDSDGVWLYRHLG